MASPHPRSPLKTLPDRIRLALAEPVRQLQLSVLLLLLLVVGGTAGFAILEGMTLLDALYMTVITLTTVGFQEVAPLDTTGRIFTIVLIVVGVGVAAWAVSNAAEVMLGQTFWATVQRRRMASMLDDLTDHYIVCGFGRLGRQIMRDLQARGEPYVVVDWSEELEEELLEAGIPHKIGDATQDDVLLEVGVDRARGLVSAVDSDANNVLTVLTARGLSPGLLIVARANNESAESKLRRAGADRVVTPESIGGHRLALALLRPSVHDFFGRVFNLGIDPDIDVGQIVIRPDSPFAGQTVANCDLRQVRNITILAVQDRQGRFDLNPDPERTIQTEETLILIGPAEAIYELEALYSPEAG